MDLNIHPIQDPLDKNREERKFAMGMYPPFTAGALYVLSVDLVHALTSADYLPRRYFSNEDETLGVWLYGYNIEPIHDNA